MSTGLTTGEVSAHFSQIYDAQVSKETISRITDKVIEEMNDWSARPLNEVYAAIFIDAIVVKIRDGQVANRPIYAHESASAWRARRTHSGLMQDLVSRFFFPPSHVKRGELPPR